MRTDDNFHATFMIQLIINLDMVVINAIMNYLKIFRATGNLIFEQLKFRVKEACLFTFK